MRPMTSMQPECYSRDVSSMRVTTLARSAVRLIMTQGAFALVKPKIFGRGDSARPSRGSGRLPKAASMVAYRRSIMKAMKNLLVKLVKDEQGGEVLEYALIAGLIVVAAIAVIGAVGTKVLARWTSLNSSI